MSESQPSDGWMYSGVRVIPSDQLDDNTPQTPGMNRAAAINAARVGAQKIWAGTVSIHANAKTGAHHHGALESVIFVLRGRPENYNLSSSPEVTSSTSSTSKPSSFSLRRRSSSRWPWPSVKTSSRVSSLQSSS